jgi:hypothetical protein
MDDLLLEAYVAAETDRTRLNPKQREYLDKIFALALKVCILNEEPIMILSHELKSIARDIEQDPIFVDRSILQPGEFSEYIPGVSTT